MLLISGCTVVGVNADAVSTESRIEGPLSDTLGDMSSDPGKYNNLHSGYSVIVSLWQSLNSAEEFSLLNEPFGN